jgi:hypothetical protein
MIISLPAGECRRLSPVAGDVCGVKPPQQKKMIDKQKEKTYLPLPVGMVLVNFQSCMPVNKDKDKHAVHRYSTSAAGIGHEYR